MSEIKVNKVSPRTNCGTVQLGDSGDTITIPAGATITNNGTQTGFGRTGTVNWDTTKKTAGFTGVSGNGYFIDTSSGAITVNLPASPSAGDIMALADYAGTAGINAITVGRNGSNIEGLAADAKIETNRESKTLVFVDATQGWLPVNDNFDPIADIKFVTATGGTVTTCGNFKIHAFTGPGTFCVSCAGNAVGSNTVDYLVVAGGGGGGADNGGGGGAGGFRLSNDTCMPAPQTSPLANSTGLSVPAAAYPITVGGGGSGATHPDGNPNAGGRGNNSVFSTITSTGGGGGVNPSPITPYAPGGSGGGARAGDCKGAGNTPPVSPPQGNPGGEDGGQPGRGSGGGGGAGAAGGDSPPSAGGDGGTGSFVVSSGFAGCNGTTGPVSGSRYFAGGGGGAPDANPPAPPGGAGGAGGGGQGSFRGGPAAGSGTTNTGGGGGGGGNPGSSGSGGSGIVIIRYKFQ